MKRILRQTLIASVGTLVMIEVILQLVSALGAPLFARNSSLPGSPDAITILCVGDSYTYGAPLPEPDSYPAQLQVLLEKRYRPKKFRVVNLAIPGVNSTFIAGRVESELLQVRPQLLMVSAGLNDRWNDLRAEQAATGSWDGVRRLLLRVKLFRLIAVATETARYVPTATGAGRWNHADQADVRKELTVKFGQAFGKEKEAFVRPTDVQIKRILTENIDKIVKTARALGVPVIWYTYPELNVEHKYVVSVIKDEAQRLDIPVVESEKSRLRAVDDGYEFNDLFVEAAGPHPTRLLYRYIVQDMAPVVGDVLQLED